ncbi:hypothetical protein [Streptococcus sp. zg-JUN1979]|uniref:hypothetical protein n=1 Tax=Streptococcus sp. zg-JUN1979 TaxID=3391450 RepID=UPI0039A609D4
MIEMVSVILLLLGIGYISYKALVFEEIGRFEQVILPAYALILLTVHFEIGLWHLAILAVIVLVSFAIASYQLRDVVIKDNGTFDKYQRPIIEIKKGPSFLIGWGVTLVLSIVLQVFLTGEEMTSASIVEDILGDLRREIFSFTTFSTTKSWYIWALTGFVSAFYAYLLTKKYPKVKESLRRRHA